MWLGCVAFSGPDPDHLAVALQWLDYQCYLFYRRPNELADLQMKTARPYRMELRAAAAEATRARILDAAAELFLQRWYDDVTIAAVAEHAGVSGQTVINHFGGKEQLAAAAHQRLSDDIVSLRYTPEAGDIPALVEAVVDDYERTGDAVVRLLALEERVPSLQPLLAKGREGHRAWVETMFGASELLPELIVATDVYTWKLLRRDQGLSRDETVAAMLRIVQALLERRTR
jgi:AcrR family transcriptional regulator